MLPDISKVSDLISEVAKVEILPRFRSLSADEQWHKEVGGLVTIADIQSEKFLSRALGELIPGSLILGEEGAANMDQPYLCLEEDAPVWIIDPLDGTSNFLRGIPHFAVSIAWLHRGRIEHAVVYDPVRQEEFIASKGRGAQVSGHRIRVGDRQEMRESLFGTGIPFLGHCDEHLDWYTGSLAAVTGRSMGVRRAGAASLDLAYVAAGRLDGFWEMGLNSWDIAAGALLVREAGGLITDLAGGEAWYDTGNVVCGNSKLMRQLLPLVQWSGS